MRMIDEIKDEHLFLRLWCIGVWNFLYKSVYFAYLKSDWNKFNMYMLRHWMATDLIHSNTSARTVQDILGHASYKQSVGYARSSDEDRKTAIDNRKLS